MEPGNCTTVADASVDDAAHAGLLDDLLARAGSCFARRETRLTCRDMVCGLLMELDDHNCWTMAEAAGHPGPYRMRHLLSRARCDEQGILDCAAGWAAGYPCAGDEDGAGTVLLLQHARDLGIRAAFVAGDEVYGGLDLRKGIRERGTGYALAVRSNYPVTLPSGRRLAVKKTAALVKPAMWQRMRTGSATKGAKDYHWAMVEITPGDTPDGHEDGHAVLLLRRHRCTGTVSYFLCWTPALVPLARLIAVAVARWRIEEDHQLGKQAARLDSGQVTTWTSWHRWTAISLLAYAFLAVAAVWQRARDENPGEPGLIPVTIPELLRQLRGTVIPEPRRDQSHREAWAVWRRRHQYQAQQAHQRRHAYADALPQPVGWAARRGPNEQAFSGQPPSKLSVHLSVH